MTYNGWSNTATTHTDLCTFWMMVNCGAFVGLLLGAALTDAQAPKRYPQCYEDEVAVRDQVPGEWECVPRDNFIVEIDSRTGESVGD